ncbi:MAG: DoxX family protein [Candidatus Marinamargulisbacteria bacterium]
MIPTVVVTALKIILVSAIFFVWVVRYNNIVSEFQEYGLPDWFRDAMGVMKLTFCGFFLSGNPALIQSASAGMGVLMLAPFVTHIKFKHTLLQMAPSFLLWVVSCALFITA